MLGPLIFICIYVNDIFKSIDQGSFWYVICKADNVESVTETLVLCLYEIDIF